MDRQMPKYRSHKEVWALEIASVGYYDVFKNGRLLTFVDSAYEPILAPEDMFSRYVPVSLDFFVVYEDGYKSFSPRKAFLEGYTKI